MNTPDHSAACAASPHFCICSLSRPGSITPEGEKPKLMAPLPKEWPIALTAETMTPQDAASLFKEPGTLSGSPEFVSASEYKARQNGSLVAAGGWSEPKEEAPLWEMPEITVKRGGIKYPSAAELLPKVRAERDTAQESRRFWIRICIVQAAMTVSSNVVLFGSLSGWW